MNMEFLFVGGSADGRRILLPADLPFVRVPISSDLMEVSAEHAEYMKYRFEDYKKWYLSNPDGALHPVYILDEKGAENHLLSQLLLGYRGMKNREIK